jgi:hypothetical protein
MAKKISYLDNLKKELSQKKKASSVASETNYKSRYGVMGQKNPAYNDAANKAAVKNEKAGGQLVGAIFMGARYDDKTGKRISGKKPVAPVMPKTGPLTRIVKKATVKKKGM